MRKNQNKIHQPYKIMMCVYGLFMAVALICDSPAEIAKGLWAIFTSSSVIITDYIFVGGLGAALVNSAIVGGFGIAFLVYNGVKPVGSTIMALWTITGFALFGNNLYNMLPIILGVYLYCRYQKEPFINFSLVALLSTTLSPVVSGIAFSELQITQAGIFENFDIAFLSHPELRVIAGILLGVLAGFLFPSISSYTVRVHSGFDLYNMGFAGGLISTLLISALSSVGINMSPNVQWSDGNNPVTAAMLFVIFAGLIVCGLRWGGREALKDYPTLLKSPGRLVSDYYLRFGKGIYLNMGICGMISTAVMLLLGCELNGPVMGGIFTIVGFAAFGKHPRNILPVMSGAILATIVNLWNPAAPSNALAILFSTGLAPIAGQFGWIWGLVAGFVHVNMVTRISFLNSGFNLYNNGYAAGFVALLIIPLITALTKDKEEDE